MEQTNYIKQLNAVFLQFSKDSRLNPTHISMYMALFQLWNSYHFPDEFYINRQDIMQFSKIGSKVTYHKCIKELHHWKYLFYVPSHNPYHGSKVRMFTFGASIEQGLNQKYPSGGPGDGQVLVHKYKHKETIINLKNNNKLGKPENFDEVMIFFKKENWSTLEAKKFYNHYQGIGWKVGGKSKIVDWKATAKNWILKAVEIKKEKTRNAPEQKMDNLKVKTDKNYDEPL